MVSSIFPQERLFARTQIRPRRLAKPLPRHRGVSHRDMLYFEL
jgi:hypothetical protein